MSRTKTQKPLPKFEIGDDYRILHGLGEGAYGTVAAAVHIPTGKEVAIKKVLPFEHTLFCLRTLRELKLLKFFSETCVNENIICILDIIKPPTLDAFTEIYFIQELMQTDLHRVIRTQQLTDDHCQVSQPSIFCYVTPPPPDWFVNHSQYFVYQTLRALKTMHSADIVHRDLKPANLLLNANCDLKVCDFGLARSTRSTSPGGKEAGLMTEYVATRWYRAPEIMLSFKMYTKAIDIWAVGCILAELLTGRPIFPGRDYGHQLDLILDVIGEYINVRHAAVLFLTVGDVRAPGTPTLEEFYGITSRRSRDYIRALPIRKRRPFSKLFPDASAEALDFLAKTLVSVVLRRSL
ncbi:hypothetical protein PHLCEN_2v5317 [Hermanssonia centrifuga]|uniref:Protein kinase domain-containing protein n=1 Tax=Hermanssonia centrifuga TaxID=98765 RepID=A0A2R6P5G7_9APHY|nr:hypothetical protein PHLCEN_2v5317 [Hermanssonia centrifuga]